ncbi:hypothetical protein [Staphylococcus haemolyticus]|nr:hypothetical protein [Staphylococcus haemolyticus]MDU0422517.1 hypothetical protein [Staphylococcus haemolyticus]
MILSNTINQRYRYATQGKTPTQIQQELRKLVTMTLLWKDGAMVDD